MSDNERRRRDALCPFCGSMDRDINTTQRWQEIDVGHLGLRSKEVAHELEMRLAELRAQKKRLVFVIHGYGSSGVGGVTKSAVLAACRSMQEVGKIRLWISVDRLGPGTDLGRSLAAKYPFLKRSSHWNSGNEGASLIEL